jgi:hypothetical protein
MEGNYSNVVCLHGLALALCLVAAELSMVRDVSFSYLISHTEEKGSLQVLHLGYFKATHSSLSTWKSEPENEHCGISCVIQLNSLLSSVCNPKMGLSCFKILDNR